MTVNAHFDGKVIVPDEPLDLPLNEPLMVQIQPLSGRVEPAEESALSWLAANTVDSESLPRSWPTATTSTFTRACPRIPGRRPESPERNTDTFSQQPPRKKSVP
jgi:hypothetical protein